MKTKAHVQKESRTAQTMIELAVFGSVLFFLIGGIASNYLSGSFQQNAQLRSMRQALFKSYQSSVVERSSARVSASMIVFEDRLTGDFGKFGTVDRQPVVIGSGGMLSAQAMQPTEWNETKNIPLMDLKVNGEDLVFRTSSFATYVIVRQNGASAGANGVQIILLRAVPATGTSVQSSSGWACSANLESCYVLPDGSDTCGSAGPCNEQFTTTSYTSDEVVTAAVRSCLNNPGATPGGYVVSCNMGSEEQHLRLTREWVTRAQGGMPPFFYTLQLNDPDFSKVNSMSAADKALAFNLRRDGIAANAFPDSASLHPVWRWGWDYFWEPRPGESEAAKKKNIKEKIDKENDAYPAYDIDGDLQQETLYDLKDLTATVCGGGACSAAYQANVLDGKLGDVDPMKQAKDFPNVNERPGIRPDLKIYGQTQCVETEANPNCADEEALTYLDIKEGKLFSDGKPVAVSIMKKNQYDVVERIYQMSINMIDPAGFLGRNPKVKPTCDNFKETCFDSTTKTLYIRSRLSDTRGHKWITDTNRTWGQSLGGQ